MTAAQELKEKVKNSNFLLEIQFFRRDWKVLLSRERRICPVWDELRKLKAPCQPVADYNLDSFLYSSSLDPR